MALNNDADTDTDRTSFIIDKAAAVDISSAAVNANDYTGTHTRGISVCKWSAAFYLFDHALEEYVPFASHEDANLFAFDTVTGIVTAEVNTATGTLGGPNVQVGFVEHTV